MSFKQKATFDCEVHGEQTISAWMASQDTIENKCPVCRVMKFSGVPVRYRGAKLTDFDDSTQSAVKDWFEGGTRKNLLILGPIGTGKTHLAACIVGECGARGIVPEYRIAREISNQMIKEREVGKFGTTEVLVVDEIGRQYDTQAEADRFFDLINTRYNNMLSTVFLGNIQKDDFKTSIGDAAADRIRESVMIITLKGASRRVS